MEYPRTKKGDPQKAVTDRASFLRYFGLPEARTEEIAHTENRTQEKQPAHLYDLYPEEADRFRFRIPLRLLQRMDPGNPEDPMLMQFYPDPREWNDSVFSGDDPLTEEKHSPVPGLIHRYPDRLLVLTTDRCAVYCRFCTRKRKTILPGNDSAVSPAIMARYLGSHKEIREVILSGGDPLSLSDRRIEDYISSIKKFPDIVSIRIHTRMLAADPDRITDELCEILERYYPITIVTHFNHPTELGDDVSRAIAKLRKAGILMLNQSVLLRNVNDNAETMKKLLLELLRIGIKPYYLHQCDEVSGVSHFRVDTSRGTEIIRELRGSIPGVAIPVYVADLPGGGGKIPLEGSYRTGDSHRESYFGLTGDIHTLNNDLT